MKNARFAGLAPLVALAACATAPAPQPAAPSAPAPAAEAGRGASEGARLVARAGQRDAPTLEAIERRFGNADVARRDGAGAILTYRAETCSLVLVFAQDGQAMRLADAQAQPRRSGEAAPALNDCASAAEARASRS